MRIYLNGGMYSGLPSVGNRNHVPNLGDKTRREAPLGAIL